MLTTLEREREEEEEENKCLGINELGQGMGKDLNAPLGPWPLFGPSNKPKSKPILGPIYLEHFLSHLLSSSNQNPTQFYLNPI